MRSSHWYVVDNCQIGFDFTNSAPTSGSWSTEADLTVKVGSDLLTVLDDMVDLGIDFWLHPVDLTLKAWESRGTDQSATVMFDTGDNLIRYSTMTERPIKTVALVRVKNGWLAAANGDLRDASGRRHLTHFCDIVDDSSPVHVLLCALHLEARQATFDSQ